MDDFITAVIGLSAIVIVMFGVVLGVANMNTRSACLQHGYPIAKVIPFPYAKYCIKRVDQTDVVVPLESLEPKP